MRYELFHDVLAEPILDWRRGYEQRRARRRFAAIGAALLALVAGFAALGIWALIEQGHAQARANDLYAVNSTIEHQNTVLHHQKKALSNELKTKRAKTTATYRAVKATNRSLRGEVVDLEARRKVLAVGIRSLKNQNGGLVDRIHRLNGEAAGLAAAIYRFHRRYNRMYIRLSFLGNLRSNLGQDLKILRRERRSLNRQQQDAMKEYERLTVPACELGKCIGPHLAKSVHPTGPPPPAKRAQARQFPTPAELKTYDALRKRVAALQHKLDGLKSRQAQIALLQKQNGVLRQQLVALRIEETRLEAARTRLLGRKHELAVTVAAAVREHRRLSGEARAANGRFRREAHKVALEKKSVGVAQSRDNGLIDELGNLQDELEAVQHVNAQLFPFLRKATKHLVRAAESPATPANLAGLFAVVAYRVTPYLPDDGAHPGPYNALWIALDRLDPSAANSLIAPVASTSGKIGTTRSKLLKQKLCSVLNPTTIEQSDWMQYLPAGPPYASKLDQPCT